MRVAGYILFLVLFISSCQKPEAVTNLSNNKIAVIGHAGNGLPGLNNDLPANSWAGVIKALEVYNADGVELDIKLSADSVLFMYHDKELDDMTSCLGCTYNYQSADLAKCSLKPVLTALEEKHYLTPVENVLKRYQNYAKKPIIFFDLHAELGCGISEEKLKWYYSATLYAIDALLTKYDAYDQVMVQANSFIWTQEARNKYPKIKVFVDTDIDEQVIDQAADNGFYGIASKDHEITKEEVAFAHARGLRVQLYGVGGDGFVTAINKSPDYILADNIPLLQSILNY